MPVGTAAQKFAEADAYVAELMREARTMPAPRSFALQRRSFLKLAGAGGAGLVLTFQLPREAFAATETPQTAAEASNDQSVNAFIRTLISRGALIDGKCTYDPTKNPPTEIALGHLTFDLEFMPPTPAERITFESFINIELLKQLGQTA